MKMEHPSKMPRIQLNNKENSNSSDALKYLLMDSTWPAATGLAILEFMICNRILHLPSILRMRRYSAFRPMIVKLCASTILKCQINSKEIMLLMSTLEELKMKSPPNFGSLVEAEIVSLIFTSIIARAWTIKTLLFLMIIPAPLPLLILQKKEV